MSHMKGRLELIEGRTLVHIHANGNYIGISLPWKTEQDKANTRRLVACWNALLGVDTDFLERVLHSPGFTIIELLTKERDELLVALEEIAQGPEPISDYLNGIRCGVENRNLQNHVYAAAEYAYEQGLDYCSDIASAALAKHRAKS